MFGRLRREISYDDPERRGVTVAARSGEWHLACCADRPARAISFAL
jgi:hypothetical protein